MVLTKLKKALEKKPMFELVELPFIDVAEDPVRPELSLEFRQSQMIFQQMLKKWTQ